MLTSTWPLLTGWPSRRLRLVILPATSLFITTDSSASTEPVAATASARLVAFTTYTSTGSAGPALAGPSLPLPPLAAPPLPPLASGEGKYFILANIEPAHDGQGHYQPKDAAASPAGAVFGYFWYIVFLGLHGEFQERLPGGLRRRHPLQHSQRRASPIGWCKAAPEWITGVRHRKNTRVASMM